MGNYYRDISNIDVTTNSLITIDHSHHQTHLGQHFYLEGYAALEDGPGIYRVKLVTPDTTKWAHFQWSISSSGILATTLHEGASGGMGSGSPVVVLNSNRNSSVTSGLTIESGVDAANTAGTLISNAKWGANGFKESIGGGASKDDEIVLKQNTIYLRTFTSYSTSNIIQFKASWYEYTNL